MKNFIKLLLFTTFSIYSADNIETIAQFETAHVLKGHTSNIKSIAWTSDGTRLASCSSDKSVIIWDIDNAKKLAQLNLPTIPYSIAWCTTSNNLAIGLHNGQINLWDYLTHRRTTFNHHESDINAVSETPVAINSIAWKYHFIVSTSFDKSLQILYPSNNKSPYKLETNSPITAMSCSNKGNIAIGQIHGIITIFQGDLKNRSEINSNIGNNSAIITSLSWSPDCKYLAAAANYNTITIWDAKTGILVTKLQGHKNLVTSVDWSPNGKFIASGSQDKTIRIWNPYNGELLQELKGHNAQITCVKWSLDNKLASSSLDRTIIIWENNPEIEFNIANHYFYEDDSKLLNYKKAYKYYRRVINNKKSSTELIAKSQLNIGKILDCGGFGVNINPKNAQQYFEQIINNNEINKFIKIEAQFHLAKLLYFNSKLKERRDNYPKAYHLFKNILDTLKKEQDLTEEHKIIFNESNILMQRVSSNLTALYS